MDVMDVRWTLFWRFGPVGLVNLVSKDQDGSTFILGQIEYFVSAESPFEIYSQWFCQWFRKQIISTVLYFEQNSSYRGPFGRNCHVGNFLQQLKDKTITIKYVKDRNIICIRKSSIIRPFSAPVEASPLLSKPHYFFWFSSEFHSF